MKTRIIVLSLLSLLLFSGCPRQSWPEAEPGLSDPEYNALNAVEKLISISNDQGEEIWPGYRLHDRTFIVFRPGSRSLLVNPSVQPEDLQRISVKGVSAPVYVIPTGDLGISGSFPYIKNFEFQGSTAMLARHRDRVTEERYFRLIVHETFHVYQDEVFQGKRVLNNCRYPYESFENAFLARVEEQIIRQLVSRPPEQLTEDDLALYLAIRARRYALGDNPLAWPIEEWEEAVEGTALYVESRYAVAAGYTTMLKARGAISRYFSKFRPTNLQKWKYYRTGTGLALMLDAVGLKDWREKCESGRCLFAYAAEAFAEAVGKLAEGTVDEELKKYEPERVATEAELTRYLKHENELLEAWTQQGSYRFTVHIPQKGHAYYSSNGTTFITDDCARFVSSIIAFADKKFGMEIRRRSILMKNSDKAYWIQFYHDVDKGYVHLDRTQLQFTPGKYLFTHRIRVNLPNFRLKWNGAGHVIVEDGKVEIVLEE